MNRKQIESKIVLAHIEKDVELIRSTHIELLNLRNRLDRWFSKYIDMFDEKMSASKSSDPVWKLYHKKSDEYSDVLQTIKTVEYYLKKP